jgi:dTDP-D-glucose 4,6-dehydratase
MRLLVTGKAGFIGANFVHYTVREHPEHTITVLDALTYAGNDASLGPVRDRIEFVHGSVADAALVDELVRRCDVVLDAAAWTGSSRRPVSIPGTDADITVTEWSGSVALLPMMSTCGGTGS